MFAQIRIRIAKETQVVNIIRVHVFIVVKPTTFPQNVPKWLQSEIREGFSAESNYVLIALVTDIELIAA